MSSSSSITLGYWKIRGLAQPIRYLLEYAGLKYDEVLYQAGGPPDFDRSQWTTKKERLGLAFPVSRSVFHRSI
jgi:glutathione S-transferase